VEFLLNLGRIRFRKSQEFINFCVTGSSGVAVNLGGYGLLTQFFGLPMEIAPPIAMSILSNFLVTSMWTLGKWRA
jgi:putative flippase GtrA